MRPSPMLTGPLTEHVDMSALIFNIDVGAFFAHFVRLLLTQVVVPEFYFSLRSASEASMLHRRREILA